jgi:hypothetical protein
MKVRIIKHGKNNRKISKQIEKELRESLEQIKTPFWPINSPRIKRIPYDVPQAWLNNILSKRLAKMDYDSEVNPFAKTRPNSIIPRLRNSKNNRQAIDFEKIIDAKRHVIEVECGNVASLYRSIHKICMAMKEDKNAVGIVIVPSRELMRRCEPPSAMSTSVSAPIILSEFAYYVPLANEITIIEFCASTLIDIHAINPNPNFWKGNWSENKNDFLKNNLELFLK